MTLHDMLQRGLPSGLSFIAVPHRVGRYEEFDVALALGPEAKSKIILEAAESAASAASPPATTEPIGVRIAEFMSATLVAPSFTVAPRSPETQQTSLEEATVWVWRLVPKETGTRSLTFSVVGHMDANPNSATRRQYVALSKRVDVSVDVVGFVIENWAVLVPMLLIPPVGYIGKRLLDARRTPNERESSDERKLATAKKRSKRSR